MLPFLVEIQIFRTQDGMWDRLLVGEGAAVGQVRNQPGVPGNSEQDGAAASEKPRSKYKPTKT